MSAAEIVYYAPDSIRELADILDAAADNTVLPVPNNPAEVMVRDAYLVGWRAAARCLRRFADTAEGLGS